MEKLFSYRLTSIILEKLPLKHEYFLGLMINKVQVLNSCSADGKPKLGSAKRCDQSPKLESGFGLSGFESKSTLFEPTCAICQCQVLDLNPNLNLNPNPAQKILNPDSNLFRFAHH